MLGKFLNIAASGLVSGIAVNAALRTHDNEFDLTAEGGTTDGILLGKIREGNKLQKVEIRSDQALGAINFTIGTDADPTAYGAAQAGPAAGARKEILFDLAVETGEPLTEPVEVKLFPSAAMPVVGTLSTKLITSKR